MSNLNIPLLKSSFAALAPQGEALMKDFYDHLFAENPGVVPLFANTTQEKQEKQLLKSLVFVVENLDNPDKLIPGLKKMGARHQGYGAEPAHYQVVAKTLLASMARLAGDIWNEELEQAWTDALNTVADVFLSAYQEADVDDAAPNMFQSLFENMPTATFAVNDGGRIVAWNKAAEEITDRSFADLDGKKAWAAFYGRRTFTAVDEALQTAETCDEDIVVNGATYHLIAAPQCDDEGEPTGVIATLTTATVSNDVNLKWALEGSSNPVMMVDRNLEITYLNPASERLFHSNMAAFSSAFPGFSVEGLMGSSIDRFHKNPSHQRALLADPTNLPHQADIEVGALTLSLNISAAFSEEGEYIGATLEWNEVTEIRRKEDEAARLSSAVQG